MHLPSASTERCRLPRRSRAPLVSWPDREGETESLLSLSCRPCGGCAERQAFALAGARRGRAGERLRRRDRADDHEVARPTTSKSRRRASPPSSRSRSPARFELRGQEHGHRAVPDIAITVDSFYYTSNYPGLAANKRRRLGRSNRAPATIAKPPVQSQEVSQPGGGQTAYVNTWALGALRAEQTQTFVWNVFPVKPGSTPSTTRSTQDWRARPKRGSPRRPGDGQARPSRSRGAPPSPTSTRRPARSSAAPTRVRGARRRSRTGELRARLACCPTAGPGGFAKR